MNRIVRHKFDTSDDITTVAGAVRYIESLEQKSLAVVKDIKKPPPVRRLFQGWSPKAMIFDAYMRFLTRIQRQSQQGCNAKTGALKRTDSLQLCLKRIQTIIEDHNREEANKEHHAQQIEAGVNPRRKLLANKWRKRKTGADAVDTSALNIDCEQHWVWDFEGEWLPRAKSEFKLIRQKMHFRQKSQMRIRIRQQVSKNLDNFKAGKVRKVLSSLFQKYRSGAHTVRMPDGTLSMNPLEVHDEFTKIMDAWHRRSVAPNFD